MTRSATWHVTIRWLHTIIAMLLPAQWCLGWFAERSASRTTEQWLFSMHFQLGIWILMLAALRLTARWATRDPEATPGPVWRRRSATLVQWLMYALLFTLPASGYVIWIWMEASRTVWPGFEVPALFVPPGDDESGRAIAWYIHVYGAWMLACLVGCHAGPALWHQFVLRDRLVTRRMWPWGRREAAWMRGKESGISKPDTES